MQNTNICRICGEPLSGETYRKLFSYVNFPAHVRTSTCIANLEEKAFLPIYIHFPSIVQSVLAVDPNYDDIVKLLGDSSSAFELSFERARLEEMIQQTFPVNKIKQPGPFIPVRAHIPIEVMEMLVAYELTKSYDHPRQLEKTSVELFERIQRGQIPLHDPIYRTSELPLDRTERSVSIPANLKDALSPEWVRQDRKLDRALWAFSRQISGDVPRNLISIAHSVIQNRLTPKAMIQKSNNIQYMAAPTPISCIKVDGLPANRRMAIKGMLSDPTITKSKIQSLTETLNPKRRTTVRVDFEDLSRLERLSMLYGIPVYKLTTALLLLAENN